MKLFKVKAARDRESVFCYVLLSTLSLACLLPLVVAISGSLSEESAVLRDGFSIFPRNLTLDTYKFLLDDKGKMILRSYGLTLLVTVLGTIYTLVITTFYAYSTSQKESIFPLANILSYIAWFTTVFSGGMLPWYLLCTRYYGLRNNIWALFIPYGMNVFNMFIMRNNFKALPSELTEAARIDGASNWQIFTRIALPCSKTGMVTIGMFTVLMYLNDFALPLYLTTSTKYFTVQRFLYDMMSNISALLNGMIGSEVTKHMVIPSNTAKMAMTVLVILPIAAVFPFVSRYLSAGITVGAVKG